MVVDLLLLSTTTDAPLRRNPLKELNSGLFIGVVFGISLHLLKFIYGLSVLQGVGMFGSHVEAGHLGSGDTHVLKVPWTT